MNSTINYDRPDEPTDTTESNDERTRSDSCSFITKTEVEGNEQQILNKNTLFSSHTALETDQISKQKNKHIVTKLKGAIKSQNMFMSSYVTLISHFYDAYTLIQSNIIFSEFKFSFYSPGQPPLENHISGKEN